MKREISILLFIMLIGVCYAQKAQSLYFDVNWQLTSQELAVYTREIKVNENDLSFHGAFVDLNKEGNQITTGKYLNGKKQGAFVFYYEDGRLNRKGVYHENKPVGIWSFFYPNEQLRYKIEFLNDDFEILEFLDQDGNSKMKSANVLWEYAYSNGTGIKGRLQNGLKTGEWQLVENGAVIGHELYKNGKYKKTFETLFKKFTKSKLISNLVFTPLYLTYSERLEVSANIERNDYPLLTKLPAIANLPIYEDLGGVGLLDDKIITNLESRPLFNGGISRIREILSRNIRPTKELDGISGRVFIDLYIDADGDPYQVEIIKSDNELINAEALRLAKLFTDWKPARYNGVPIASKVTLPLKLSFKRYKQN